jgi:acyl dehydratase
MDDQFAFAELSGDFNPMHMDARAARRTQAGKPVVHGVHAATWAMESVLQSLDPRPTAIRAVKVQFNNFIHVGVEARVEIESVDEALIRIRVSNENAAAIVILLSTGQPSAAVVADWRADIGPVAEGLLAPTVEEMQQAQAWLPLGPEDAAAKAFPATAAAFGKTRVSALLSLTRLVGMSCPGLHSIFGSLNVKLNDDSNPAVAFRTRSASTAFRLVKMDVAGGGLEGSVTAFVRTPPVEQPRLADLVGRLSPAAFAGVHALVVGGSRGLGALVAKMIVSGGGEVVATYAQGAEDAEALKAEILADRPEARFDVARMDVRNLDKALLERGFNQVWYFATPTIYRQKSGLFLPSLFEEFCRFYIYIFEDLARAAAAATGGQVSVFYPSSIFVEAPPPEMVEYAMAKAAGELLCDQMDASLQNLRVVRSRLPKLLTDQTAGLIAENLADPVETFLPILARMAPVEA